MTQALRSPAAFAALRRDGRRARRGTVTVTWVPIDPTAAPRVAVAYAVGRRVGGAVVRNRIRRRLRTIVGDIDRTTAMAPGDYLLSAGPEAATLPYDELRRTVTEALQAASRR